MSTETVRCSQEVAAAGEPLAGSAPATRTWLVLEHDGPFGADPLLDSGLADGVGEALAAATDGTATRVLLVRRPGRGAPLREHRFWLAHVHPGNLRMRVGTVPDLRKLLVPDLHAVLERAGRGELPAWGTRRHVPLLLVCTNGRRDACCAIDGRALLTGLGDLPDVEPLECTHLGGHRFAPTALALPTGMAYGRLTVEEARQVALAVAQDRMHLRSARGATGLAAPAQVADLAVRTAYDLRRPAELDVLRAAPTGKLMPVALSWDADGADVAEIVARHEDGRAWSVTLHRETAPSPTRASCKKPAQTRTWWVADPPEALSAWH